MDIVRNQHELPPGAAGIFSTDGTNAKAFLKFRVATDGKSVVWKYKNANNAWPAAVTNFKLKYPSSMPTGFSGTAFTTNSGDMASGASIGSGTLFEASNGSTTIQLEVVANNTFGFFSSDSDMLRLPANTTLNFSKTTQPMSAVGSGITDQPG